MERSDDTFRSTGLYLEDDHLTADDCKTLLGSIASYRRERGDVIVERDGGERPLRYSVIDGLQVKRHLPEIMNIYGQVNELVDHISGLGLVPLENERVGCNVNIMGTGNTYRWHYDRNAVTAILYLNDVKGGETECYPNYRILLGGNKFSKLQKSLDRVMGQKFVRSTLGKQATVFPKAGRLLVMRGDRCLHSVRPVTGNDERINIIMSYDLPGRKFSVDERLDGYLYSRERADSSDPNYV